MAVARQRERWGHTSNIIASITNAPHFKPQKRVQPSDVNPYSREADQPRLRGTWDMFLAQFKGVVQPYMKPDAKPDDR